MIKKKNSAKKNTARKPAKKRNSTKKAAPKKNAAQRKTAKKRNSTKKAAAPKKNAARRRKPAKKRNVAKPVAAAETTPVKKRKPAKKRNSAKKAAPKKNAARKPTKKRNSLLGSIGMGVAKRVIKRVVKRRRRNPDMEAPGALREAFLGRPADGVDIEFVAPEGTPAQVDQLAPLHSLEYRDEEGQTYVIDYDKLGLTEQMMQATGYPVMLCGKRTGDGYDGLYIVNQPSLLTDEVRPGRCGELTRIRYWAVKTHLGDKEPVLYWHEMGEESGVLPELALDKEGFVKIRGGEYYIPRDDFGGYSSGIHN
jgi:hypothetical protein